MRIPLAVLDAIQQELDYQDAKFGSEKEQSFPGYCLIIRNELKEAEDAWTKGPWEGRNSALAELTQVAAVAIRALSNYGTHGCPAAKNDERSLDWAEDLPGLDIEWIRRLLRGEHLKDFLPGV